MKRLACFLLGICAACLFVPAQDRFTAADPKQVKLTDSATLARNLAQAIVLIRTDTARAVRMLSEVRRQASNQNLNLLEAAASVQMGHIFFNQQIYHRAFGSYNNAKNIYDDVATDIDVTELTICLARTQYYRGNYKMAVSHFVEGLEMARKKKHMVFEIEALENLGLLYNSFQGFNEGTRYYLRAYKLKKNLNDVKGAARVAQILGETYYRKRLFDSSLYFSQLAAADAEATGLKTELYMAEINKAMSMIRLKQWNDAELLLKKISTGVFDNQDENRKLRYEIAMGNLYLSQGDSLKANYYYGLALTKAKVSTFPEMYALIYRNIAECYYELRNFKQAYEYFNRHNTYVSNLYSGRNLANLGSLESIMNAATSKDEARKLGIENELKQSQLFKELLMRQSLERENALMDSIISTEKILSEALSRERYSLERENHYKSQQLVNEKQLREQEQLQLKNIRKNRELLIGGLAITLLLGTVIFLLFRKQIKKNAIIQKQADDMQVLMKEIHHRVKNNLQIISSLLDLQSLTIKDQQASEAVKEGKNRVQSMALIHQNLYNEGNIKGIEAKGYISNLVSGLCGSYNIHPEQVNLTTEVDDLVIDVDTMIPLGLVLNELVSNALKYAFSNRQPGALEVVLKQQADKLLLKVRDNGPGFPAGLDIKNSKSFGLKMIRAFAQKLKATLNIKNENGAVVEMLIAKYKTV